MLIVLPLILTLFTAAVSLICWRKPATQRVLSLVGTSLLLVLNISILYYVDHHGMQVITLGNWPAPFGITFVADHLSCIMLVLTALSGFAVAVYSFATIDTRRETYGYHPLFQVLLLGICGAFLTGDLFNLYVWFEVVLMASFVLLGLGGERAQLEGSIKYVTLNLFASVLFLSAVALLYGLAGTLNMADLAIKVKEGIKPAHATALSMLFIVAFGIKAAIFPFFSWLPASYHVPPIPVTAIFAAILAKIGVYSLIRIFSLIFVQDIIYTHQLLLILAGLTMVTGVLGALAQEEFRRILAFHSVSQIGYMIMGLGIFTPIGLAGAILFFIHHSMVKTCLFLISGVVKIFHGSYDLKRLGGVSLTSPGLSIMFFIAAMSLAGLPPFSGFIAKFILIYEGIQTQHFVVVTLAIIVSLLTLVSMTKIWTHVFWKKSQTKNIEERKQRLGMTKKIALYFPIVLLTIGTILVGLAAGPIYSFAKTAAMQLYYPQEYIEKVLGKRI